MNKCLQLVAIVMLSMSCGTHAGWTPAWLWRVPADPTDLADLALVNNAVNAMISRRATPQEVTVKTLKNSFTFPIDSTTLVSCVKEHISTKEGVPAEQQRLFINDIPLEDSACIQSALAGHKTTTVNLLLNIRG